MQERETEARRWTYYEAKLVHIERVGYANGESPKDSG